MRATNLTIPFTCQFYVTASGTPEQLGIKLIGSGIAFNDNGADPDTITDTGSNFLVYGFQEGDSITVSGSASNDGTYIVATVSAGTLTLLGKESLTTEAAGSAIKITADKQVPDGVAVTIKAKRANTAQICLADKSEKALNSSVGFFSLAPNEAVTLQISKLSQVWVDAEVSLEGVEVIYEKAIQA